MDKPWHRGLAVAIVSMVTVGVMTASIITWRAVAVMENEIGHITLALTELKQESKDLRGDIRQMLNRMIIPSTLTKG